MGCGCGGKTTSNARTGAVRRSSRTPTIEYQVRDADGVLVESFLVSYEARKFARKKGYRPPITVTS